MGTQVVKGSDRAATVAKLLEPYREPMARLLPRHIPVERALELCAMAIRETPKLLECTQASLVGSLIECTKLGLSPNNHLGHAYLIPFRNSQAGTFECQLVIGYQGFLELVRRSGSILKVESRAVFGGDEFDFDYGTNPYVKHKPAGDEIPASLTHVYAIAWLAGGVTQFDVMSKKDVDRIRSMSKAGSKPGSPWVNHYVAMAKKTVIRRLCKTLPCSDDLRQAVAIDEREELDLGKPRSVVIEAAGGRSSLDVLTDSLLPESAPVESVSVEGEILDADAPPNKPHLQVLKAMTAGVIDKSEYDQLCQLPTADQPAALERMIERTN
jgi:recombination protein RecT